LTPRPVNQNVGNGAHTLRMQRAEWTAIGERIRRHLRALMADGMPGWLQQRLLNIPRALDVLDTARTPEPDVGATIRAALDEVDRQLPCVVACARSGDEVGLAWVLGEIDETMAAVSALTQQLR